ncbi:hypothetical protein KM1_101800 [Entamoeba histolytica HM-3:IMSS]|uniref:Uncharacterized protein n=1 Tax=Entamoeba histolytica HM-3:IMSS TaxID=885315 RepID=M7X5R6_ENTHI|nr:hypothetical protein KM1_101800 [Entamoeba histolytica HM-3:IMSS]
MMKKPKKNKVNHN